MRKAIVLMLMVVLLVSSVPMQVHAAYENTYTNTGNQRADIIGVALTQVGYTEGANNDTKYGTWAGHPNTAWCGWFVSWCARQAGIPTSVLRTNGLANPSNFGLTSYYTSTEYTPRPGDLFFKKNFSHVGIVYYVDGAYFYTLEGNTSTTTYDGIAVMSRRRALSEFYFAPPAYTSDDGTAVTPPPAHTHNYSQVGYDNSHPHKEYKKCSCGEKSYTGNTRTDSDCSTCAQSSCEHTYGNWSSAGNSNHQKKCTKCGYKQTASHTWKDGEVIKEATCKEPGEKNQVCSECSAKRTQKIEKLDDHEYEDWIPVDEQTHKRICKHCEKEETGEHFLLKDQNGEMIVQGDDKGHWYQCADCCQKTQVSDHNLKAAFDESGHWQVCQDCERVVDQKSHTFDHDCDKDCGDCEFTRETTHTFGETINSDDTAHWYACINCNERKDEGTHSYQMVEWENDTFVEQCSVCGYMSGKVVEKTTWEKLREHVAEKLTVIGRWILPIKTEAKWYMITAAAALVLVLAILITVPCVIVHAVRKKKKAKAIV